MRMMARRITGFSRRGMPQLAVRTERGDRMAAALPAGLIIGAENPTHTYWVMPLRIANQDEVVSALRDAGFDATHRSSLIVVPPAASATEEAPLAPWLDEIVFVPNGSDMPDGQWERLISILQEIAVAVPPRPKRELAALAGVSVST
jgi:hypothetical protein